MPSLPTVSLPSVRSSSASASSSTPSSSMWLRMRSSMHLSSLRSSVQQRLASKRPRPPPTSRSADFSSSASSLSGSLRSSSASSLGSGSFARGSVSARAADARERFLSSLRSSSRLSFARGGDRDLKATSSAAALSRHDVAALEQSSSLADFELLGVLGRGTFGVVRLARHRATGHAVALKTLDRDQLVAMRQETNILREQSVHLSLRHAFVARLYATFQDQDAVYFVVEYCPGGELYGLVYPDDDDEDCANESALFSGRSLDLQLDAQDAEDDDGLCITESESSDEDDKLSVAVPETTERRSSGTRKRSQSMENRLAKRSLLGGPFGGLRESHAAFYLACLVATLEYLHAQGVMYRDLKLENLVIDADGYPKLIDFGLSKPDAIRKRSSTVCGSMEYMAPELVQRETYDHRADVWSFGIVMYELLCGVTPFCHGNLHEQRRRICEDELVFTNNMEEEHPQACELLRSLLHKDARRRPSSFRAVREHAFFAQFFPTPKSWRRLLARQVQPPFVPQLSGPFDTSLFANAYEDEEEEEEDM
ncbi:hypothetical protein P43SY_006151 [Pythium insidiosum]|uniref:AGC protein kinase n=1 Tax=Pythium insidiosum TaxID=114742 RepID=A0AAD5M3K9_PYTIN|nr:hypothetical protein P43SY_006151 [Pythium insidiosum]